MPNLPQLADKFLPQNCDGNIPQVAEIITSDIFSTPWDHHRRIIDRCNGDAKKALFYVHQTVANGWSRNVLLNFLDSDLYERQGKALSNFSQTLPSNTSELAQELTKDPYNFSFTGIKGDYNERLLKDKLLNNLTQFLIELGTGFAYVGREYRLPIGETEGYIDLLFYNLSLSCYVVKPEKPSLSVAGYYQPTGIAFLWSDIRC